ncbi:hypothetical protein TBLA_0A05760 [Henningerozyma blattae CBS 6284]|uniref:cysteine--tRNA ligase n=1 Tax=Henningerozyma blattae (strain ATCC 34711 / CBS 6284 / DSM 70876 / NBRC 10599 / NRRL Y-10934 / UCD 77-7) TaxID=1071380 RepID=I2GW67_HENB6|nr:hypothetical protein TBLA_0A05760 [Tetrapisispora blattae CBS 6284]CCH58369.1 hypothetical protein TBLA_0A05760 [Tetrapisispora blattae CBS 6284]
MSLRQRLLLPIIRMSSTSSKVNQPKWYKPSSPTPEETVVLKLYNTLTRSKEEFIPISKNKNVTWYSCGPTVYDSSHMGHARNYVSIDINRRILQDYFGYNINFVQNVTDIDDKIIIRARQNYLFENFMEQHSSISQKLLDYINSALFNYINSNLNDSIKTIPDFQTWVSNLNKEEEKMKNPKFPMHLTASENAIIALSRESIPIEEFFKLVKDVTVPLLDSEFGSTINDPEVFKKLPAYWERQFDRDMSRLNVLPPTLTTRVSEYVPEIITFVEKIIANGYAYPSDDGSVYFDTVKFDASQNHDYAKCQPWNKGQLDLINDAEGSLTNFATGSKKSPNDFALWKNSKPGEPEWVSPWGKGRPGWHIECSVMASDIHGESFDIHSGGIDLAFPHHDNELAQSEAHFDYHQWVNYFLHTGHLHIEGQKMSKSLKNFITIEEALKTYSPRQLRLCFASVQWNNQLDFKESLINEIKSTETTFNNFFMNIRAFNNDYKHMMETSLEGGNISKKLSTMEKDLMSYLFETEKNVHTAFCDNLSTPQVMKHLLDLVTVTNNYITKIGKDWKIEPLMAIIKYITKILGIIGFEIRSDGLGWASTSSSSTATSNSSTEEIIMPYVKVLSKFRDDVRSMSINKTPYQEFLKLTDVLRDVDLLNLNIAIDDRNNQSSLVKFLTDEEKLKLIKFNEEKEIKEKLKMEKKLQQQKLNEEKERLRAEKAKISPKDMFKTNENFSAWDEDGLPTKDKDGNDVTKSMLKKLKKQWEAQRKLYEEYNK